MDMERPRIAITAKPFLVTAAVVTGVACISLRFGCNIENSLDTDLATINVFAGLVIFVTSALLVKVGRSNANAVARDEDMLELNGCYARRLRWANRVEPLLRYLSWSSYALVVVHICRPFTHKPLHLVWDLPWTMTGLLVMGWAGGVSSFCGFVILSLAYPCWLASAHIERIFASLEQPDDDATQYYYEEGRTVHEADEEINREFYLTETGLLWLTLLVATAISAVLGMFLVVRSDPNTENHTLGMALFFLGGILTAAILLPLALLNSKCDMFLAAARIHLFRQRDGETQMPTDDVQAAHHRFVSFVEKIDLGIKLCGIRITLQWVVTRFTSFVVVMPSLYAFLLAHFKPHSTQHLRA